MLNILKFPDPRLRDKSKKVEKVGRVVQDLAKNMFETMYESHGIGLAAPQLGELVRLIVMDIPLVDPVDPQKTTKDPLALVNPQIVWGEGDIQYEEGCLSCPELVVLVDRLNTIRVSYLDLNGKPLELTAAGLKSVCIQHEIDHLNGTLLVDKISRLKRDLYKQKRLKIAKEEKEMATIL